MPTNQPSYHDALSSLEAFSHVATARPLRPYQLEAGNAVVEAVLGGKGGIFTILMARQSGKNELAAQLEAYLLCLLADAGGLIVKAAPSYNPQVMNSIDRLHDILDHPFFDGLWHTRGRTIVMGKARMSFFSAAPDANIVGATASTLLAVDEAQDVDEDVYNVGLRPMASAANAVTVLYGTAWDEDNVLERQRRLNRDLDARTGRRSNFEYPWQVLAAINPRYKAFVTSEIAKHGTGHYVVKTQYDLEPVPDVGRLFPPPLLDKIRGSHLREVEPALDTTYVAGVDVAGSAMEPGFELPKAVLSRRDETVINIAAVDFDTDEFGARTHTVRVVEIVRWKGLGFEQARQRALYVLRDVWNARRIAVDATGVGDGLASYLASTLPARVQPVVFTAPAKSLLGYRLVTAAQTGRLSIFRDDTEDSRELWRQLANVKYELKASEQLQFGVPPSLGHDDCVMSLALAVEAAASATPPHFGGIVRARDPLIRDLDMQPQNW